MIRMFRLLFCLVVIAALGACGNKGDLVKRPADPAPASTPAKP
jgi:predicted small lipoprotein YifL